MMKTIKWRETQESHEKIKCVGNTILVFWRTKTDWLYIEIGESALPYLTDYSMSTLEKLKENQSSH